MHRFSISVYDFEEARRFLTEAQHHNIESASYEALLITAIIYFARPFSCNEKIKNSKVISKIEIDWFSNISLEERAMYDDLLKLRNKCLAHAEFHYYPTSVDEKTGVIRSRRFRILDHHLDVAAFRSLLDKFIDQAHNKRADYTATLKNITKRCAGSA